MNGTIEEEVEDGECVELAGDLDEQQEVTYNRRTTTRRKIAKATGSNKLVASETFHNVKKGQIVKRRHTGRNQESRARDDKSLPGRTYKSVKEKIQNEKNNLKNVKKREIELAGKRIESVILKSAFDSQLPTDSRREWKCKFCGNLFVSKGALSFHMASEQCL